MKTPSFDAAIRFGLLYCTLVPSAHGKEYLFDKDTDGVILSCAIAFLVLCVALFILVIIVSVFVYKKAKSNMNLHRGYHEQEAMKGDSISSPFYGHGMYLPRPESSIYLPGRESSYINVNLSKSAIYRNEGVEENGSKTKDSPPTEKGQRDAKMKEKKASNTYDNPAFESPGYESLGTNKEYESLDQHDYEMLDVSSKPGTK